MRSSHLHSLKGRRISTVTRCPGEFGPERWEYTEEVCLNAHRDKEFVEIERLMDLRAENMEEGMLTALWGQLKVLLGN